ncbi:MAG: T9SS C-terminal target domain-containing protein [Calditrichaeota bacterium]|nr:MAG: T9SS C-terminal target domain-containing protein [Calditrichota bacterium]
MRWSYLSLFIIVLVFPALSQDFEYPEDAYYSNRFGYPALSGGGNIVAIGNDMVYIARDIGQANMISFDKKGYQIPYGLAKWDGNGWTLMAPGYLNVNDLIVYGTAVIAAGKFTEINGEPFNYIASWTGGNWQSLDGGANDEIFTLATDGNSLYAGGRFTRIGDTTASHVALFDGIFWYPMYDQGELAQGTSGEVHDIDAGVSEVYVAGSFGTAGGQNVSNIAAWSRNPFWKNLSTGTNNLVRAVTWSAAGPVIGGDFTTAGGSSDVAGVAYFDGSDWQPMGAGANGQVLELTNISGEAVGYGRFDSPYEYSIARFRNGQWETLGATSRITVNNMVSDGANIWAGTHTSYTQGTYLGGLATWDGERWKAPSLALGGYWNAADAVNTLALWTDGSLIAGGSFALVGGDSIKALCRWTGDGWQDMGRPFKDLSYAAVNAMQIYNGKLYVAGYFDDIDGTGSANIGMWDGSTWSGLQTGTSSTIYALGVHNNQLFVGGNFWQVNGQTQYNIASWDGNQWHLFDNPPSGTVYDFLSDDTLLYVGGAMTAYENNSALYGIAAWDGAHWQDVGGGVGGVYQPTIRALVRGADGLYAAGLFTTAGSVNALNIARWDGQQWHALGEGLNGEVHGLYANGNDIYAGGNFVTADGDTVWSIARWDGSTWHRLGNGMHLELNYNATATVKSFLGTEEGLWIGGNFSHAGVYYSNKIALYSDFDPVSDLEKGQKAVRPNDFRLYNAYPNPFNPETTLRYALPRASVVRIDVYDLTGKRVHVLEKGFQTAGTHRVGWNGMNEKGRPMPSGLYIIRMRAGGFEQSRKVVLIK